MLVLLKIRVQYYFKIKQFNKWWSIHDKLFFLVSKTFQVQIGGTLSPGTGIPGCGLAV